jgi:hypothetical protein
MKTLENFIGKTGRKAATLGLAGILTAFPGTSTAQNSQDITPAEGMIVAEEMMNLDPRLKGIGGIFGLLGRLKYNKERDELRTQINLNIQNPQQGLPENVIHIDGKYYPAPGYKWVNPGTGDPSVERNIALFAANYYKDFDLDGKINYPTEYVGIKNEFYDTEGLTFNYYERGVKTPREVSWKIYGTKGELLASHSREISKHGAISVGHNVDLMGGLVEASGYGPYVISWMRDGLFVGKTEVTIKSREEK